MRNIRKIFYTVLISFFLLTIGMSIIRCDDNYNITTNILIWADTVQTTVYVSADSGYCDPLGYTIRPGVGNEVFFNIYPDSLKEHYEYYDWQFENRTTNTWYYYPNEWDLSIVLPPGNYRSYFEGYFPGNDKEEGCATYRIDAFFIEEKTF